MDHKAYTVAWICALPDTELPAAGAMLDEEYPSLEQDPGDTNIYTFGRIGPHNVVIACLPAGRYGTVSATGVTKDLLRTFPSIQLRLMVGIGGGLPNPDNDIHLGDVVVSQPVKGHAGVIQYDLGKSHDDGTFERRGQLDAPPAKLLNAISKLRGRHVRLDPEYPKYLAKMLRDYPKMAKTFGRPGPEHDVRSAGVASRVGQGMASAVRAESVPWYGLIASGNRVVASVDEAKRIENLIDGRDRILCFEMEAAGLMNDFHCVVIRGISDYADSLKNDHWQPYAAATAAAYAKELLKTIPAERDPNSRSMGSQGAAPAATRNVVTQGSTSFGDTTTTNGKSIQGNMNGVNFF